jgi:hypothetical protein
VSKPTIGQSVLFYPKGRAQTQTDEQPCAATVTLVSSDTHVTLAYFDANGVASRAAGVHLAADGEELPEAPFCCSATNPKLVKKHDAPGVPPGQQAQPAPKKV